MKLKILNLDYKNYPGSAQQLLKKCGLVTNQALNYQQLLKKVGNFDILVCDVVHKIDKEVIKQGKKLKVIATAVTGIDQIDAALAQKQKIKIISLKGEREFLKTVPATAELTFSLLLALTRQIVPATLAVKNYQWQRSQFKGTDLNGKTFGIIGFGRLGKITAGYAQAFGMKVIVFDPYLDNAEVKKARVKKVSLEQILRQADIVSIHASLSADSHHLVGLKQLKMMKNGSILLNTARGQLIDEKALLWALKGQKLAGAALDVLADEKAVAAKRKNALIEYAKTHNNLIITPHIGGMTNESADKTRIFIAKKVFAYCRSLR